jgi:16S rRNA (cytosine1402-N4)-methyltransferase
MKKGNINGVLEKDFFGNPIKDLKEVTRKVIVATKDQIMENTRARSAKLRIAEKA